MFHSWLPRGYRKIIWTLRSNLHLDRVSVECKGSVLAMHYGLETTFNSAVKTAYTASVSVGEEFGSGLMAWFWGRASREAAAKLSLSTWRPIWGRGASVMAHSYGCGPEASVPSWCGQRPQFPPLQISEQGYLNALRRVRHHREKRKLQCLLWHSAAHSLQSHTAIALYSIKSEARSPPHTVWGGN